MPPSFSATTFSPGDDHRDSSLKPNACEISDNEELLATDRKDDVNEEEEEEYEYVYEEVEEELDEEEEEVEVEEVEVSEEEVEEEKVLEMVIGADDEQKTVKSDAELKQTDLQLGSHSSEGKSELRLPSNSLVEDRVYNSNSSGPPNKPFTDEEESHSNVMKEEEEEEVEVEEVEEEEEVEVEEIEEEEEVELEEVEVFEEEVEEEDVLGEAIGADEEQNDAKNNMELKQTGVQLGSQYTEEKTELGLPSGSLLEDRVRNSNSSSLPNKPLTNQQELYSDVTECKYSKPAKNLVSAGETKDYEDNSARKTSKECSEPQHDVNAYLGDGQSGTAETSNPSSITGEKVVVTPERKDCSLEKFKGDQDSDEEVKSMDISSECHGDKLASRSDISGRTRSPLSDAQCMDTNKRPALVCNYFAKGWCIKGSSCRFLHKIDKVPNSNEQPVGDAADTNLTRDNSYREGLGSTTEKPKYPTIPEFVTSPIDAAASQVSLENVVRLEVGESKISHLLQKKYEFFSVNNNNLIRENPQNNQQFLSLKYDYGLSSFHRNVERENLNRYWPGTDYHSCSSPIAKYSSPLALSSMLPECISFSSGSDAMASKNISHIPSYFNSLDDLKHNRGRSMIEPSLNPRPGSGIFSSHHLSAWTESSYSLRASSTISSIDSQKLLGIDRENSASRSAALLHGASSFSCAGSDTLHLTLPSKYSSSNAENAAKRSSNDWEPSIPFRPSFFITCTETSSPGSLYDPLRDSIDTPNVRERSYKFSFLSQGTSVANASQSQHRNASATVLVKNILNKSQNDVVCGTELQIDGLIDKEDLKVEKVGENSEMEVDQNTERGDKKESMALRQFRSALIDFVKELLKPTWHKGRLKKNAHNTIVKKVVEKVLTTMKPHQIPDTKESIKQYLSTSRPKIEKLVEGYITKNGKT